ncbi:MAG: 50S ribosomal protein L4 [Candidatus Helarchaeota archaeon]|nr:50S ribosomal protein L4 [Candidatus Helarchaeota archaeon]
MVKTIEPKVNVLSLEGKPVKTIPLPDIFQTPFRPDIIHRAFVAAITHYKQPQGVNVLAGKRSNAESSGPGRGISRVPRVRGSGTGAANQGNFVPQARGGRQAFPPVVEKVIRKETNRKERLLAIRSAIAITANKAKVIERGHKFDETLEVPMVLVDDLEKLQKTKEVRGVLQAIGLADDLERASIKKIRAGRGKMRGRKYKRRKSALIVVAKNDGVFRAARNIPGIDIVEVKHLSTELLAPGGRCGRLLIWSESAMNQVNSLFI